MSHLEGIFIYSYDAGSYFVPFRAGYCCNDWGLEKYSTARVSVFGVAKDNQHA